MNIIYIHQFFCTPKGSSGTRSYNVSCHLAKMGHKVTIICGMLDMGGLEPLPWYKLFSKRHYEGFDVIVCNVKYSNYMNSFGRMFSFIWFAFLATLVSFIIRKPDIVFSTSLPLTVGIPGYICSRVRQIPFVFEVRDIFPEGDVIAGNIKAGSLLERVLSSLERFIYLKSNFILLVSLGFEKRLVERGYPAEKMKTILLGADGELFKNVKPYDEFRIKYNLQDKTICVYAGAHGRANGLDYILDAAHILIDRTDISFVLIGDGREKPRLIEKAAQLDLKNILFLDFVPKTQLPSILAACDIGLMILYNVGPRPVTPNKIFDYMFSGLPSIINFEGPTIEMVENNQVGVYVSPTRPDELAEKIVYWTQNPKLLHSIGAHAREIAYEKFDYWKIAEQLAGTFRNIINTYNGIKNS